MEILGLNGEILSEFGEMGAISEAASEFQAAINGLDDMGDFGSLGAARVRQMVQRPAQQLIKTTAQVAAQNRMLRNNTSHPDRAAFEARMGLFPQEVREGLKNKRLQAVEAFFFSCKGIAGRNIIDMFKDDDNKVEGFSSLSGGKLDVGTHMILTSIMLLKGTRVQGQPEGEIVYDVIPSNIRNGEIEMTANTGSFILPKISMEIFDTSDMTNVRKGVYALKNPKYLKPEQPLNLRVYLPTMGGADEYLKIGLLGVATHKY